MSRNVCEQQVMSTDMSRKGETMIQELKFENYGLGGAIFSCIYELEQDEESSWWQEYPAGPLNLINCTFNENYDSIFCSGHAKPLRQRHLPLLRRLLSLHSL